MGSQQDNSQILLGYQSRFSMARRGRRGAALLVMVLLTVVAATILLVFVKQGLDVTRNESNKNASRAALAGAEDMRTEFEQQLEQNPVFFLSSVHSNESPRICVQEGVETLFAPGDAWPSECGTSWEYAPVEDVKQRMEITPPSIENPLLHVQYLMTVGPATSGLSSDYSSASLDRAFFTETGDLDVSQALNESSVSGASKIYSNGNMSLPPSGGDNVSYATEGLFSGQRQTAALYASTLSTDAPIRQHAGDPVTDNSLKAAADTLKEIACRTQAQALCLEAGRVIKNTAGEEVTLPSAQAWMVVPGETSGTLSLLHSSKVASFPTTCAEDCNFNDENAAAVAAGLHPGDVSYWTPLAGSYAYPASGVAYVPSTTFMGYCGVGFMTGENCVNPTGVGSVNTFDKPLSIITGTTQAPKDIYISGSLLSTEESNLSLFATRNIIMTNWAHSPGGELTVDAALTSLGDGTNPSIFSVPSNPSNFDETPYAGKLTIKGAITGSRISVPSDGFSESIFSANFSLIKEPSPYLSNGVVQWNQLKESRLTPEQIFEMI